jgi:hypothetical protein
LPQVLREEFLEQSILGFLLLFHFKPTDLVVFISKHSRKAKASTCSFLAPPPQSLAWRNFRWEGGMVWILNVLQGPYIEGLVSSLWCFWEDGGTFWRWVTGERYYSRRGHWSPSIIYLFASCLL